MQKSWFVVVILAAFYFRVEFAMAHPQHDFMRKFQSAHLEFPDHEAELNVDNPGRYPHFMKWILQSALSWNPEGDRKEYSAKCNPQNLFEKWQGPKAIDRANEKAAAVESYLKECHAEVESENKSELGQSIKIMSMQLDLLKHPFLHVVKIHMPNGVILKGLLALHGDMRKRPFVIIRNGIFSNIPEFLPERYLLMQIFEQSPANVLVVENMTSSDFIANNNKFSLGGFEEGLQNIWLAKTLQSASEPISKIVQNVSLVGVSLGGGGVIAAAEMNRTNSPIQGSLIQQFVAICPVVNLRDTADALVNPTLKGTAIDIWVSQRLAGLRIKNEKLQKSYFSDWIKRKPTFLENVLSQVEKNYDGGLVVSREIQIPNDMQKKYFWAANDLSANLNKIDRPLTILATQTDRLVPYALNAKKVRDQITQKKLFANVGVVLFDQGIHCSLPTAYNWDFISDLMNGLLLTEKQQEQKTVPPLEMQIDEGLDNGIFKSPIKINYTLDWPEQEHVVTLKIQIDGSQKKTVIFHLSLELVDFNFLNNRLSKPEKRMIERWLYRHLQIDLYKKNGKPTLGLTFTH